MALDVSHLLMRGRTQFIRLQHKLPAVLYVPFDMIHDVT